jgi:SAM-dependent methyltransferase
MNNKKQNPNCEYWNDLSDQYQKETHISTNDFHYGPLLPGDSELLLLPHPFMGKRCLEIGCGAGQNSIYLAKQGAECVASDVAPKQIEHGKKLAALEGVQIDFQVASMDELDTDALGRFDFIHSTYALPFADNPEKVIRDCAKMLKPDGVFLLTTGHPLHSGEWLEVDECEDGLFIPDYFNLAPDARVSLDDPNMIVQAKYFNLSLLSGWLHLAGLKIDRLQEPQPLPIPDMSPEQIAHRAPYWSEAWMEHYDQLSRVPIVVILRCVKK